MRVSSLARGNHCGTAALRLSIAAIRLLATVGRGMLDSLSRWNKSGIGRGDK
jgi:hypothetical protein